MQIYVSGSLAFDRIMDFPGKFEDHILPDKIHVLNVCFTVNGLAENFGGTAGNIAYSLSLLNEAPLILASAGSDFDHYQKWLHQCGLPTAGIHRVNDTPTACAYITTDQSDNQITGFNPGAMQHPSNYQFENIDTGNAIAIVAPGNLDDMRQYSQYYQKTGIEYIFDPGQSIPALTGDDLTTMIKGATYLISNDYELELIKKATGLKTNDFLQWCRAVITTLGAKGSLLRTQQGEIAVHSARVKKVVDPTGAGDAFRAGLLKGLVEGKALTDSVRMGTICASYVVEKKGPQAHAFSPDQFERRYQRTFG